MRGRQVAALFGDYRDDTPPAALIAAVVRGDVNIAAAWGPLAGSFSVRYAVPLRLVPVQPQIDPAVPAGVRHLHGGSP
jgi:mxaJ protein